MDWGLPPDCPIRPCSKPCDGGILIIWEIKLTPTLSSEPNAGRSSCPDYSEAADISQVEVYTKIPPLHNKIHDESNESPS